MKKVKPFPGRKMVKVLKFDNLVVERRRLSRFPAKMTLVHACALLSIEKISYSQSSSSQNLKLSNILKRNLMLVI